MCWLKPKRLRDSLDVNMRGGQSLTEVPSPFSTSLMGDDAAKFTARHTKSVRFNAHYVYVFLLIS